MLFNSKTKREQEIVAYFRISARQKMRTLDCCISHISGQQKRAGTTRNLNLLLFFDSKAEREHEPVSFFAATDRIKSGNTRGFDFSNIQMDKSEREHGTSAFCSVLGRKNQRQPGTVALCKFPNNENAREHDAEVFGVHDKTAETSRNTKLLRLVTILDNRNWRIIPLFYICSYF